MDVKLALGYLSCVFAGVATYYEWKTGFQKAKPVTLICVVSYFVLNTLAWLYASFVEKQDIFVGTKNVSGLSRWNVTFRMQFIWTPLFARREQDLKYQHEIDDFRTNIRWRSNTRIARAANAENTHWKAVLASGSMRMECLFRLL